MAKKKHKMSRTDMARIFLSQMGDDGKESPTSGPVGSPAQTGFHVGDPWTTEQKHHVGDTFSGASQVDSKTAGYLGTLFGPGIDRMDSYETKPNTETDHRFLRGLGDMERKRQGQVPLAYKEAHNERLYGSTQNTGNFVDLFPEEEYDYTRSQSYQRNKQQRDYQEAADDFQEASDEQKRKARNRDARGKRSPTDQFGAAWNTQDLFESFDSPEMSIDTNRASRPGNLNTRRAEDARMELDYRSTGIGVEGLTGKEGETDPYYRAGLTSEQKSGIKDASRAGADNELKSQYTRAEQLYTRLGTEINKEKNPEKRNALIQQQNEQIQTGLKIAQTLGIEGLVPGKFPHVQPISSTARAVDIGSQAVTGGLGSSLTSQMGQGASFKRGELFRGTSYASTGAINGVMKALAGIFILFVFIGVFYMVFGPIYDSLIFNFTSIVSADGDPTLGGKDIPTLFDNTAKVILVWVPLIVFAGALYKLTALVFEREGGSSSDETEWDILSSIEDSTDLDAGSDPGVFASYGGGGLY